MNKNIIFLTIALFAIPTYLLAAQSQNLESVFLEAVSAGQTDMVKSFLDKGANIEFKNDLGATPLIFAAAKGHAEVVSLLLDRGAKVNSKTSTGITPLMAAASGGYADIVKLLLAKGADVCAKDKEGRSALSLAKAAGDSDAAGLLKSAAKSCAPEKPRVASRGTSYSRQSSAEPSDSGSAESESSEPTPDVSGGGDASSAGQQGGPLSDLLNNPIIQQAMSQILGGQTSAPGPNPAVQGPDVQANVQNQPPGQAAQDQLPAQGANAQGNAPAGNAQNQPQAQAGNPQNQAPAKGADPNLVTTPFTTPGGGLEGTKTFNRTTQETEIRGTSKDPNTGQTTKVDVIQDKAGNPISGTMIRTGPTQDGGQEIVKDTIVKGKDMESDTVVSKSGDSFKTTNFDNTGNKTSDMTMRPDGSSTVMNYTGSCTKDGGPGCKLVSSVDKDPKTNKMTTTKYDQDGKVIGTQVSDIPKNAQQNAATLKALKKPAALAGNNLAGNNKQHDLQRNKLQGLAGTKEQVKADVLGQLEGKPTVTTTKNPDGTSTVVTKDNTGATTKTVLGKDGKTVLGIQTFDNKGNMTSTKAAALPNANPAARNKGPFLGVKGQMPGQKGTPGNPIVTKNPDGSTTYYEKEPDGSTRTSTIENHSNIANSPLNTDSETIVDKTGKTTTTTYDGTGKVISKRVSYVPKDAKTNPLGQLEPSVTTTDPKTGSTTTRTKLPNGTFGYVTTKPDGSSTTVSTSLDGSRQVVTKDKDGKTTTTRYARDGKVISKQVSYVPKDATAQSPILQAGQNQQSLTAATQQNLRGNKKLQGNNASANKDQVKANVLNQIQNKAGSKGVNAGVKADVANQIGIKPGGGIQANQKGTYPEKNSILMPNKNTAVAGKYKIKEGLYKGEITPGSKFKAIPHSQSPSEFSQGNMHQPQNKSTKDYNAKSKSLNWNSSAGSQATVKQQHYEKLSKPKFQNSGSSAVSSGAFRAPR